MNPLDFEVITRAFQCLLGNPSGVATEIIDPKHGYFRCHAVELVVNPRDSQCKLAFNWLQKKEGEIWVEEPLGYFGLEQKSCYIFNITEPRYPFITSGLPDQPLLRFVINSGVEIRFHRQPFDRNDVRAT